MKKITVLALSILFAGKVLAAPQDASIKLPIDGSGEVKPDQEITLSLAPVKHDVLYDVSCKIDNAFTQNIIMKFAYTLGTGGIFSNFKLNGTELQTNQGYILPKQNNEVVARVSLMDPKNGGIIFTNLDHDESVFVHDCVANPAVGK